MEASGRGDIVIGERGREAQARRRGSIWAVRTA
jgi:hypothetical protein